jgi:hypothetical protein
MSQMAMLVRRRQSGHRQGWDQRLSMLIHPLSCLRRFMCTNTQTVASESPCPSCGARVYAAKRVSHMCKCCPDGPSLSISLNISHKHVFLPLLMPVLLDACLQPDPYVPTHSLTYPLSYPLTVLDPAGWEEHKYKYWDHFGCLPRQVSCDFSFSLAHREVTNHAIIHAVATHVVDRSRHFIGSLPSGRQHGSITCRGGGCARC